ncbi:hypothetical protein LINPERHAP1_LOCUS15330 [Linum perenne]
MVYFNFFFERAVPEVLVVGEGWKNELRENPKKSFQFVDPEFYFTGSSSAAAAVVVVQDEQEPMSSVSNASPEEDVAMVLVMMSREVNWRILTDDDEIEEGEALVE